MSRRRVRQPTVPLLLGLLLLAASPAVFAQDTTPPQILSRETADLDGDGLLEAIHIIFNEPILDATVMAGDFNVLAASVEAFSSTTNGDTADDADIYITFKKSPANKTNSTPPISYTAGTLTDLAGNPLASTGMVASTDKAGPAVMSAVANDKVLILVGIDSDDTVTLTFSEATNKPVITGANIDTLLRLNNGHTWLDGSGAIGAAQWNPPGDRLTITMSTATSLPTVAVGDTITLGGGQILDRFSNPCSTVAFSAISGTFSADLIPPFVVSRETADLNTDGFIDAVRLSFSEPVRDSTVTATDFGFSGGVTAVGFTTGAAANDAELFITFTDGVLGTEATPTVGYTAGTLTDMPGNFMASAGAAASADKAPPAIISRETADLSGNGYLDALHLTFSEPISDATVTATDFGFSGGVTAVGFTTGAAANDAELFITFSDGVLTTAATPTVSYTSGTLRDLPGNLMASTGAVASTDKAGPALLSAVASDGIVAQAGIDADDTVTLTFSEATSKPTIDSGNINTALDLSGHSWRDGTGGIGSAVWNATRDVLIVTLSVTGGAPSVAVGDTITLGGGVVKDAGGNLPTSVPFSALSGSFVNVSPPVIISLVTADTTGPTGPDGFIDRLIITFDRTMDESTIPIDPQGWFSVSAGSIASVADDGTPGNPTIWVNLTDGVLGTGAEPRLTIQAGGIQDTVGNANALINAFPSTDEAAPRLRYTLAVVGEKSVYVRFSEPVNGPSLSPTDFGGAIGVNTIQYVVASDPRGGYADGVFLCLANPILYIDVLAEQAFTLAGLKAAARDRKNLLLQSLDTDHRISDLLLGTVQPVWAVNFAAGSQGGVTAKSFNGSETLDYRDVTVQAMTLDPAVPAPAIYYDSNVSQKTNGLWLPAAIPGLASANGGAAGPLTDPAPPPGNLYTYQLPQASLERGRLELVFQVNSLYCLRVLNPKDPRSLAMWSLNVQVQQSQRGEVTILDNVLRTGLGGKTTVVYTLSRRGSVTILVSDMRGDIVAILVRAVQDAGQHAASWDGRNRAGRIVAPGLYYVKVVGPGINEVRKVLVGK